MSRLSYLPTVHAVDALLDEHPGARALAEEIAFWEQQLGQEAMALILEYFEAEVQTTGPDDPRLQEVVAKIEAFERSRGR
jgi:hypothetical protein